MEVDITVALITALGVVSAAIIPGILSNRKKDKESTTSVPDQTNDQPSSPTFNVHQTAHGDNSSQIGLVQGDVYIGITSEQYEQGLKRREQEVRTELAGVIKQANSDAAISEYRRQKSAAEQLLLEQELKTIQQKLADKESAYQAHIRELQKQIARLEEFEGQVSSEQLAQAKEALQQGDTRLADQLFEAIYQSGENQLVLMAEAKYQQGLIAEEEIRYQAAFGHFKRATQLQPENTTYLNKVGELAYTLGNYIKAIEYLQVALDGDLRTYGEDHPKVAIDRNNLGSAYKALGQYEIAIEHYQRALASDLKTYGESHPQVAIYRNNLGEAYRALGQYEKAIEYFQKALDSDLNTYGDDHPQVAIYRNNLGGAYKA
ncbi:MAG: tetratricopeptide repeat protein, partial [Oceanobacter sp.]